MSHSCPRTGFDAGAEQIRLGPLTSRFQVLSSDGDVPVNVSGLEPREHPLEQHGDDKNDQQNSLDGLEPGRAR